MDEAISVNSEIGGLQASHTTAKRDSLAVSTIKRMRLQPVSILKLTCSENFPSMVENNRVLTHEWSEAHNA